MCLLITQRLACTGTRHWLCLSLSLWLSINPWCVSLILSKIGLASMLRSQANHERGEGPTGRQIACCCGLSFDQDQHEISVYWVNHSTSSHYICIHISSQCCSACPLSLASNHPRKGNILYAKRQHYILKSLHLWCAAPCRILIQNLHNGSVFSKDC